MNITPFRDHFSDQAKAYLEFRPAYPGSLYEYLASMAPSHQLAWDCATGNGQCAHGLSSYFQHIIASDASAKQIEHAKPCSNIEYRVLAAEHTDIMPQSVDLITVAQALHWFDIPTFFKEAQRVLKNRGIISVCTYSLIKVDDEINQIIHYLYHDLLANYWPAERKIVENAYRDIDFPFAQIEHRVFEMAEHWSLSELLGYLGTWSAVQAYRYSLKTDPLVDIRDNLIMAWGDVDQKKTVNWPLSLMTGRYVI
ncbi:MAG: class I SAM-dependent methyltransferase [Gammaproteobacteria bacterium]